MPEVSSSGKGIGDACKLPTEACSQIRLELVLKVQREFAAAGVALARNVFHFTSGGAGVPGCWNEQRLREALAEVKAFSALL